MAEEKVGSTLSDNSDIHCHSFCHLLPFIPLFVSTIFYISSALPKKDKQATQSAVLDNLVCNKSEIRAAASCSHSSSNESNIRNPIYQSISE